MMSRFYQEISGMLDAEVAERKNEVNNHFWQKRAQKDAEGKVMKADRDAYVDEKGVIRWHSNNRCLMDDYCEVLEYMGYDFSREATREARDEDTARELAEYRRNYKGPSEEERAEMRAAFGTGQAIVDIISGERIYL